MEISRPDVRPVTVSSISRLSSKACSTELIYCWDPDGPNDPRGFARADHCDHIHVGWDG
jgi:hypothetical protein